MTLRWCITLKLNRTSSIAKKNMRKKGATSNRPEQMLLAEIIKYHITEDVETEVKLKNLKPKDGLDFTGKHAPRPDILFEYQKQKFIVRVNGPYHDSRERYDKAQKLFLEIQDDHYTVIDVSYVRHEILFKRNKERLTKIELFKVLDLVFAEFLSHGIRLTFRRTAEWLKKTDHMRDRSNE